MPDDDLDPTLDRDLARWHQPTPQGEWRRLPLKDKDVEALVHLKMRPGAELAERARDLWPKLPPLRGIANFQAAVNRINAAASKATGKSGNVIRTPEAPEATGPVPTVRVQDMRALPCVEAWVEG